MQGVIKRFVYGTDKRATLLLKIDSCRTIYTARSHIDRQITVVGNCLCILGDLKSCSDGIKIYDGAYTDQKS